MENTEKKPSFLRNHADTLAIIGVNIGIAGILLAILISNISTVNAANARMDAIQILIHNESKEFRSMFHNEAKEFHGRLCSIEERYKAKQ